MKAKDSSAMGESRTAEQSRLKDKSKRLCGEVAGKARKLYPATLNAIIVWNRQEKLERKILYLVMTGHHAVQQPKVKKTHSRRKDHLSRINLQ